MDIKHLGEVGTPNLIAEIGNWFARKQGKITANGLLKGDANGNVSNAVAGTDYQLPFSTVTITLAVASWSSNAQTVTVSGMTTSKNIFPSPAPASHDAYNSAGVRLTAQGTNTLTFGCTTTPTVALTVNLAIWGTTS